MALIDVYLGSKELKRTIVERSFQFEIPLKLICAEAGINYKTFLQGYVNSNTPDSTDITEKQFEKVLGLLGIEVRTQFIIQSKYKPSEVRQKLEEKYAGKNKRAQPFDTGSDNIFG
jgi:hypothetical protein